ncbi:MAG: hypothetical protein KTV77_04660 [Wolbachia endosymbiont of Fragariocoptes setiger]|nr:hypothetical protein [Wolbachia endosymbiont of Fragariocoptes setiger]
MGYKVKEKEEKKGKKFFKIYREVCNKYDVTPVSLNNIYGEYIGFAFIKNNELTISYRGTKNVRDLLNDIDTIQKPFLNSQYNGSVHGGFLKAFQELLPSTMQTLINLGLISGNKTEIYNVNIEKINFIGFSLGAAITQIAALYFHNLGIKNISVTIFGSPRVFHKTLCKEYNNALGDEYP